MSTQQQLEASAGAHARSTSWTWDKYLATIRSDPSYAYKNTEWYRAGSDLEQTKGAPPAPAADTLGDARCRMFLADKPLDCLQAPTYMIPVCTADLGYRQDYSRSVIDQLRARFARVEAWCDCRAPDGTPYPTAVEMVSTLGLDGPAWGQCEAAQEFDHAYANGCRRMIGNLSAIRDDQLARVASGEVHVTVELYRNTQPWQQPDWRNANAGVGGNCIACYESTSEGASYMSVATYKADGYYITPRDSVYGVGLKPADWQAL